MPGIAIFGVNGRMGQALLRALREAAGSPGSLTLTGAIGSSGSGRLGHDAVADGPVSGVWVTADHAAGLVNASVAVDFSLAHSVAGNARACVLAKVPLLVGTTGFDATTRVALEAAAAVIPVLIAPNTSVGVTVLTELVARATRALGPGYDVEICEAHHRMKRDAPSGTALALGEAVAGARGRSLSDVAVFDRHGQLEPRHSGEVGFAVIRAGDIVGDHTVTFAADGEQVSIAHRATDRMTFARGAVRAAAWLAGRPPGLYGMRDVIGLEQA